jgi:hypothetical protein
MVMQDTFDCNTDNRKDLTFGPRLRETARSIGQQCSTKGTPSLFRTARDSKWMDP